MSAPEILNPVPVDLAEPWLAALVTGLAGDPWDPLFALRLERRRAEWRPERAWAVRDRGRVVGTLATEPRVLTVPAPGGGTRDVDVDALTAVSVAATHRRRGLLRRMITASLQAAKDRGDPFSVLVAAEWPIYGRFGYAPATRSARYTYRPRGRGATIAPADTGTVRQVDPDEALAHAPAVFDAARRRRAGHVDRPGLWWAHTIGAAGHEPVTGSRRHWLLHEGEQGVDGVLAWRPSRDWDIHGDLAGITVGDLHASTDTAYRNLWAYLSGIDIVDEITLGNRPVDEPARWLPDDGRALRQDVTGDFLWLRLLDLPRALALRGWAAEGRLVLDVVDDAPGGDPTGGYAAGRVRLDATPEGAECTPTRDTPDLRLPARTLAAAYLGGHSLQALAAAGRVDELRPGALGRLDAMLATGLAPWCGTGF